MGKADERDRPKTASNARADARFARVSKAAVGLADVELTTYYGEPALKVRGEMFVCIASHSSAEPDSLVVRMPIETRDVLIEEKPALYYIKPHYVSYPSVLVRLTRVNADELRDLVRTAWRFVTSQPSRRRASKPRRRRPPTRS